MNKFDERYEIRLATYEDIEMIMKFIKENWKSNHIMAKDRAYFEYEFYVNNRVNFVMATDRSTGDLEAIVGFLPSSINESKKDIWGSFWKVNENHNNMPMLGVELERRMDELSGCRFHNGIGINAKTAMPLVRLFLKNKVAKMNQYYMINNKIENYKLVCIDDLWEIPRVVDVETKEVDFIKINTFEELKEKFDIEKVDTIPYKDEWYVRRKFFDNPRRKYQVYGLRQRVNTSQKLDAFFVTRVCEYCGAKALRIMDYYGDREVFASVGCKLYDLMTENQYEYIDFYNYGFEENYLHAAGFKKRDSDNVVIPNYFEPFERRNVDIWVHFKNDSTLFFKADGDQDRANIWHENE